MPGRIVLKDSKADKYKFFTFEGYLTIKHLLEQSTISQAVIVKEEQKTTCLMSD